MTRSGSRGLSVSRPTPDLASRTDSPQTRRAVSGSEVAGPRRTRCSTRTKVASWVAEGERSSERRHREATRWAMIDAGHPETGRTQGPSAPAVAVSAARPARSSSYMSSRRTSPPAGWRSVASGRVASRRFRNSRAVPREPGATGQRGARRSGSQRDDALRAAPRRRTARRALPSVGGCARQPPGYARCIRRGGPRPCGCAGVSLRRSPPSREVA